MDSFLLAGTWKLVIILLSPLVYILAACIYNVFFSPLSFAPGPILWRASPLPWAWHALRGTLVKKTKELHGIYGPVVRISPRELSYADSGVWTNVYMHRPGKPEWPKDPTRLSVTPNKIPTIISAGKQDHARLRRLLAHAFSEKGLREQSPIIQKYVDQLMQRLGGFADAGSPANLVSWYIMTGFDIIGDLGWGETFHCLETGEEHEWITIVLPGVQYITITAVLRTLGLGRLIPWLVSKHMQEKRLKNFSFANIRINNRIAHKEPRGDFWDKIMVKSADDNKSGEGMMHGEMVNNATTLVIAGSETSSTALSGATFLLLKHPDKMKKLVNEVRSTFSTNDEITTLSVGHLKYTMAVLEEALRMYPPAPIPGPRNPPQGGGMLNGHFLPEDTIVSVTNVGCCSSEANFHRASEFIPERWLDDRPAEFENDNRVAFQPFSAGTRNCIGRNLAYAEMKLILAKVVYNFDLSFADEAGTGNWLDQKAWALWEKPPLNVILSRAEHS
ncbi:cytochrome P450 [Piedraia hortae CBS 480.64]|uniref:Cytochrome P450 n=1 Tax=Piedraia hortae CBS 480.64 TaxID=1314780 RepID=A0A6A7CA23_9PEZI|nr:cytochrome P450 [Piedraia hortae CBS 480.64]